MKNNLHIAICELCKKRIATQNHHLFSQTRLMRRLYKDLLDRPENIIRICESCHLWKPIPKIDEIEFCNRLKIIPRSKTGIQIWERMKK